MGKVDVAGMSHSFSVGAAVEVGVNAAILLGNIAFWAAKNAANGRNAHDGRWWTYNSVAAFHELFPYMSEKQIRGALSRLEKGGYIVTGAYNRSAYDRTKWYAVTELGCRLVGVALPEAVAEEDDPISPDGQIHLPKGENQTDRKGEPIPDINPDTNQIDIYGHGDKSGCPSGKKAKKFVPPTREELVAYMSEKGYRFDPDHFLDYYSTRGWHDGRDRPVKDWRRCCVTWAHNSKGYGQTPRQEPEALRRPKREWVRAPYGWVPKDQFKTEEELDALPGYYRMAYETNIDEWNRQHEEETA